ncbi:MAG: hypothetical protein AMJ79_06925 [Phycisphaerae bacterium SM23_30]|nr:MAG: hypothetical protein AMJ79_06925 [Phycisphaerae bacterium SM23_30]
MAKAAKDKKRTFEEALAELEEIVSDVEAGEIGLEESIDKYEAGMRLIKHCRAILERAEKRIEVINKETHTPVDPSGTTNENHS